MAKAAMTMTTVCKFADWRITLSGDIQTRRATSGPFSRAAAVTLRMLKIRWA